MRGHGDVNHNRYAGPYCIKGRPESPVPGRVLAFLLPALLRAPARGGDSGANGMSNTTSRTANAQGSLVTHCPFLGSCPSQTSWSFLGQISSHTWKSSFPPPRASVASVPPICFLFPVLSVSNHALMSKPPLLLTRMSVTMSPLTFRLPLPPTYNVVYIHPAKDPCKIYRDA